jgi:transketolase
VATRKASQQALEAYAKVLPELLGGAADLTGSVFTNWSGSKPISHDAPGNYINFGVREFGMSAIANGLAVHGGFIPYVGTFLTFSDYSRNALRMAALMKIRSIFVFTHDSIGLGEDGPTHQSIEHAPSLRLIPHMDVWRPCDTVETAVAWAAAIERADGPSCLLFTRQNVPFEPRDSAQIELVRRGGYVLADWNSTSATRVLIIATGSEVGIAMGARTALAAEGIAARVVSMPCTSVFDRQEARLSRERACGRRAESRHRSRRNRRLAQVRRRGRRRPQRDHRHRPLRRIGARSATLQVLRLYGRERRRHGETRSRMSAR